MIVTASPNKFSSLFNDAVPGAYRSITAQDVIDLTGCGLIGKYKFYGSLDIETIRCILLYEELRLKRRQQYHSNRTCKRCGESLPDVDGGRGRPREYWSECEKSRVRDRFTKHYQKKRSSIVR